ncbi:MAG: ASCH domain-containing protein [Propionibacteriaceae bacterium]|nr:ASCH domain-containing protein [Propionibacteriaceae bacterium]
MMLPARIAQGVRDGSISLAYRRWEEPRVRAGGTQLTSAGIVRFEAVDEITDPAAITDAEAREAGFADAGALLELLAGPPRRGPRGGRGGDRVFRVRLAWVGEDPRVRLRAAVPDPAELAEVAAAVARLDAGRRTGPWTRQILEWIRDHPGVISTELAALLGREVAPMKADIRRLKALGLTESLRVGYRLSPRGVAYLGSLG